MPADGSIHDALFSLLPVIPELKLTDRGLVDVGEFRLVEMFS